MILRHTNNRPNFLKHQHGFGIASALFALLVGSIVAAGVTNALKHRSQQDIGAELAKRVNPIRIAVNEFVSENYTSLQRDESIIRNGITLINGTTIGTTLRPRVEDLVSLNYLPAGYNSTFPLFGEDASFLVELRKEPAGCAPDDCEIPGYIYLSKPALRNGSEPNAVLIGKYRVELGPDALIASNTRPGKLISGQGVEVDSPVAGQPAGVLGALVGWGSSTYGNWLTLNDTRDPNFRGDLSAKGEVKSETSVTAPEIHGSDKVGAGKGDDGLCNLSEMSNTGEIFSRITSCLNKVVISPSQALISTFYNSGRKSIEIQGEQGSIVTHNTAGKKTIHMDGNTSELLMTSANDSKSITLDATDGSISISNGIQEAVTINSTGDIRSTSGSSVAGITNIDGSGRSYGEVIAPRATKNSSSVCSLPNLNGDIAKSANGTGLVICSDGVWLELTAKAGAVLNQTCSVSGQLGNTANGSSLICSGGRWVSLDERFGKKILVGSYFVSNGTWVTKPACVSGSTGSVIYIVPKSISTQFEAANFAAIDMGSGWQTVIQNNLSASISGEGIAMIYCIY